MTEAKAGKRKYLPLVLRIAVVAGGITWGYIRISREVGWDQLADTFLRMNPAICVITLAIFVLSMAVIGLRWWVLLRAQAVYIPFWVAVKLYFLGWFYNICMPGSVGGDLVRAWYITHHTDKKFVSVLSVFVDRLVGLISTLIIAVLFYFLFLHGQAEVPFARRTASLSATLRHHRTVLLLLVVAVVASFIVIISIRKGRTLLKRIWASSRAAAAKFIKQFKNAVIVYLTRPLAILLAFALTVSLQIATITGFYFLGRSMGIDVSVKYYYVFFTLTWVLGAVPVSIGGAVVVEGALVILFTRVAGTEESAAWALALAQRGVWLLAALPGAVIHITGAHLPKNLSLDLDDASL
jgi:uncharacterized protein (TIRG00374 family)